MTSASKNSKRLLVIPRSTFAGGGRGACTEFEQAKYPFKWRKHVCTRCGALRAEHRAGSGKATAAAESAIDVRDEEEEERHLPPRKRLMLRFLRFQLATLAASGSKETELEEGEIRSPDAAIAKGKRGPRRKRADAP